MTTLEKIRAEIQKVLDKERDFTSENAKAQAIALNWVLALFDKYAEQEPTSPCDLCGFNTGEFCGYLGECPAIEKEVSKCHTV